MAENSTMYTVAAAFDTSPPQLTTARTRAGAIIAWVTFADGEAVAANPKRRRQAWAHWKRQGYRARRLCVFYDDAPAAAFLEFGLQRVQDEVQLRREALERLQAVLDDTISAYLARRDTTPVLIEVRDMLRRAAGGSDE